VSIGVKKRAVLNIVLQLEYLDSSIKLLDVSWMILTFDRWPLRMIDHVLQLYWV